jgi:LmbE family N-acetylglucosaminyl deacetylase
MSPWLALATANTAFAAAPGEILRELEHLRVAGTVLYVAAHPDDENTSLLAWLEGDRGIRAVYLSMTRGGGGQNLVGAEQGQLLGVVRTGELMAARSIDGAEQRFTRTVDFGYSKSAEETLALWGHDEALDDVVRVIREVRPDVLVTRFPTEGQTHGHHLASARLAHEAFALAADPAYVTPGLDPWTADRLLHNVSSWSLEPTTDTSAWARVDVNSFDPLLGSSYTEIAAASRSMHKSQGFGSAPEVGPDLEYFRSELGTPVGGGQDPLAGLDLTLARFEGTERLDKALRLAAERFDPRAPHLSLPRLALAHERLADLPDSAWRARKTAELEELMAKCAGLWLTARAERAAVAPGQTVAVELSATTRAPVEVQAFSLGCTRLLPACEFLHTLHTVSNTPHVLSPSRHVLLTMTSHHWP